MDRFIGEFSPFAAGIEQSLKSNMDRFIVNKLRTAYSLLYMFKIHL